MVCFKLGFGLRSQKNKKLSGESRDSRPRDVVMGCFNHRRSKAPKNVEVESVQGGEDVWDSASTLADAKYPEHLVVMVNGIIGR